MAPPVEHNEVFLAIGKNERDEHLEEISPEILSAVREKPLNVKAFAPDDPNAPPLSNSNVKISHWIRHGQGFHNLMAEMARAQGRVWKNVSGRVPEPELNVCTLFLANLDTKSHSASPSPEYQHPRESLHHA
jgi:hypothetical protein